ncbi:MAG: penicillin-binding protein activator [Alphaproteobacteria bacterium]|nr:penicillin-binding protein activator [Alphaproteobacteria bacterium]
MRDVMSLRLCSLLALMVTLVMGVSGCGGRAVGPLPVQSRPAVTAPVAQPVPPQVPAPAPAPAPVPAPAPAPAPAPSAQATPPTAPGSQYRVALLVPLTGSSAAIGEALLNSAQLALFETADNNFILQSYDTQGKPDVAAAVAATDIQQGAQLIIGPVFSPEVKAVAPVAAAAYVNVIAFSTDPGAAGHGVYIMGFLLRHQVQRVATFAHQHGLSRFAALAPANDYGRAVVLALREAVTAFGGVVLDIEYYDPAGVEQIQSVQRLARLKDQVDAVLIPDRGVRLKQVANLLPYLNMDLRKVRLLGTQLWDEPGLGSERVLVGGWYAAPFNPWQKQFAVRYRQSFGTQAPPNSSLAYDAIALAATLARAPGGTTFDAAVLTTPSGFNGVDGLFRFRPDGTVERSLAVLEVTPNGINEVSPAPTTFAQPLY